MKYKLYIVRLVDKLSSAELSWSLSNQSGIKVSDGIWRIFQTLKSYILAKRIKSKSNKTGPANLHQLSFLDVFIKLKILWNQSEWWVSEVIWQIFLTLKSDLHFETRIKNWKWNKTSRQIFVSWPLLMFSKD